MVSVMPPSCATTGFTSSRIYGQQNSESSASGLMAHSSSSANSGQSQPQPRYPVTAVATVDPKACYDFAAGYNSFSYQQQLMYQQQQVQQQQQQQMLYQQQLLRSRQQQQNYNYQQQQAYQQQAAAAAAQAAYHQHQQVPSRVSPPEYSADVAMHHFMLQQQRILWDSAVARAGRKRSYNTLKEQSESNNNNSKSEKNRNLNVDISTVKVNRVEHQPAPAKMMKPNHQPQQAKVICDRRKTSSVQHQSKQTVNHNQGIIQQQVQQQQQQQRRRASANEVIGNVRQQQQPQQPRITQNPPVGPRVAGPNPPPRVRYPGAAGGCLSSKMDLAKPLFVDCSVEYELPNIPKIPADSQPLLVIPSEWQRRRQQQQQLRLQQQQQRAQQQQQFLVPTSTQQFGQQQRLQQQPPSVAAVAPQCNTNSASVSSRKLSFYEESVARFQQQRTFNGYNMLYGVGCVSAGVGPLPVYQQHHQQAQQHQCFQQQQKIAGNPQHQQQQVLRPLTRMHGSY